MLEQIYLVIKKTPINKTDLIDLVPILKELDGFEYHHPLHPYPILEHSIKAAETLEGEFLRLAMIFHDIGKLYTSLKVPDKRNQDAFVMKSPNHEAESARIVNDLFKDEMDKQSLNTLAKLIEYHDTPLTTKDDETVMKQLIKEYGLNFVESLLKMQRADMSTHSKKYYEKQMKPQLDYADDVFTKKYKKDM